MLLTAQSHGLSHSLNPGAGHPELLPIVPCKAQRTTPTFYTHTIVTIIYDPPGHKPTRHFRYIGLSLLVYLIVGHFTGFSYSYSTGHRMSTQL